MLYRVPNWTFLTNHARALLCIARDPGVRLRDIATSLQITERSAYGIVTDLAEAGYVVKNKDGRRNRYRVQIHLPLPEATNRKRTVGELLALLLETDSRDAMRSRAQGSRAHTAARPSQSTRKR